LYCKSISNLTQEEVCVWYDKEMKQSTIGGGVVVGPNFKIAVVNHNHTSWSLPKGHVDPGETLTQATVREIKEEAGLTQLTFVKELGTYQRYRTGLHTLEDTSELKTITIFLYTTTQTELRPIDPEHPEARWVDIDEVSALLTHPKDKDFFEQKKEEINRFISSLQ
jgi:8-oxo-dGTP pyrophosphatase MutT (NUDIX family)